MKTYNTTKNIINAAVAHVHSDMSIVLKSGKRAQGTITNTCGAVLIFRDPHIKKQMCVDWCAIDNLTIYS